MSTATPSRNAKHRPRLARRATLAVVAVFVLAAGFGAVAVAADAAPAPSPALADEGPELGRLFPTSFEGRPLELRVWTGPEWLARFDGATEEAARALEAAEGLFAATGTSADEITVATTLLQPSAGNFVTLAALQVTGVDAHRFVEAAIGVVHPEIERPGLELDWISERTVFLARDRAMPGSYPVTVYAADDIVWFIDAGGPLREELLTRLPPPPPTAEVTYDLASVFPTSIGGNPRDALTLRSGALGWGMPVATLARLEIDGLVQDVVLMTGAGWYELNTASGLAMQTGLLPSVTASQVAGADEDLMRRVRDEILLPRIGRGEAQGETVEIAGRELLRVTAPRADQARRLPPDVIVHLYVSGDTIWWLEAEGDDLVELVEQLP